MDYEILPEYKSTNELYCGDWVLDYSGGSDNEVVEILAIDKLPLIRVGIGSRNWETDYRCVRKVKKFEPLVYWAVISNEGFRFFATLKEAEEAKIHVIKNYGQTATIKKFQEVKEK